MPQKQNTKNKRRKYTGHVKASISYVAAHKHTGHRLAHKHTSHGILLLILIAGGLLILFSLATLNVAGITSSHGVTINATVPGPPPVTGAIITTPQNKVKVKQSLLTVSGTCPAGTLVAVYNNGLFATSSVCTSIDAFSSTAQLQRGSNTIQAQNYDSLDQPGPVTDQIGVEYAPDTPETVIEPAIINKPSDITVVPSLETIPAEQPADNSCFNDSPAIPQSSILTLVTPCVTRNVFVGEALSLPITFWGGIAPYSLSVDWGDKTVPELLKFSTSGHKTINHTYQLPEVKNIALQLADATGRTYQTQAVVDVSPGVTTAGSAINSSNPVVSAWVQASVPLYWAAVTLFLGFWVGDLFRRFVSTKKRTRRSHA